MDKYIPPQLRNIEKTLPPTSRHADLRMRQRNIDNKTLKKVLNKGTKEQSTDTITHRTEDTFCVSTAAGKVITVMKNYQNTEFDLLNRTRTKEKKLLAKVAQQNDVAMCELADFYLDERFTSFSVKKAYNLFLKAATKHNNSHAMCKLAGLYDGNLLGTKNHQLYLEWMTKAADRGNKYATAIMGQYLMNKYRKLPIEATSEEREDLSSKVMEYFEKSAAKGSTRAMWHIAFIYQTGFFGEKDIPKAINIFIKAAKRGSPGSLQSLQDLAYSKNIKTDLLEDILDHISPIIAKQSSEISVELGLEQIYGNLGENKEKASARGLCMLEAAARHRNEDAFINLIELYKEGSDFIAKDSKKVIFWAQKLKKIYEKAALEENINAKFSLGALWLSGDLGTIDNHKALKYLNDSISSGDASCIYSFGMLLMEQDNKITNHTKGKKLINQAIDIWKNQVHNHDDIEAAINIAEIYYDGDLGESDYIKALEWFNVAANLGDSWSKYYLAKIHLVKLEEKNVIMATNYMEQILNEDHDEIDLVIKLYKLFPYLLSENNGSEGIMWLMKKLLQEEDTSNNSPKSPFVKRYLTNKYKECYLVIKDGKEIIDYPETIKLLGLMSYTGLTMATKLMTKLYCTANLTDRLIIKNEVELFNNIIDSNYPEENKLFDNFILCDDEIMFETLTIESEET